jgi:predicted dehydrogenase
MSEGKLKAAVLGLNDRGKALLEAASSIEDFEVVAVADNDSTIAEKVAAQYKCEGFDDYRQLITVMDSRFRREDDEKSGEVEESEEDTKIPDEQEDIDEIKHYDRRCLLVAAGMHSCEEYVRMAIKKKFNVLKLAPAARDFEEAAEFVRLAENQDIKFAIGNPNRFAQSFVKLRSLVQEGQIEQVFLITAFCTVGDVQHATWQTDPKLAGGGVLLHNCYHIIDQINSNFCTPELVYSLNTNAAADRQQRHYLTEDTAVVTMKFSDTCFGNLIATRRGGIGPSEQFLKIYGKDKVLTVTNTQLTIGCPGKKTRKFKYEDDESEWYVAMLEDFALSIISPDEHKLSSSGRENLANMAVIGAAYLSARTATPEEPGKILKMAQIEPEED